MDEISLVLNPQRSIICQYSEKALIEEFSQIKLHWQIDRTRSRSENREYLVHSEGVGELVMLYGLKHGGLEEFRVTSRLETVVQGEP